MSEAMLKKLVDELFDGSAVRLIEVLIQSENLTDSDLDQIRRMIFERKREGR